MDGTPGSALPSERKTVGLVVSAPHAPENLDLRLFEWLSAAFPVRFEIKRSDELRPLDGVIYIGNMPQDDCAHGLPSLVFLGGGGKESATVGTAVFSRDDAVHPVLRGRSVEQRLTCQSDPLEVDGSAVVLASFSGRPLWTMRRSPAGRMDVMAMRLPVVDQTLSFFDYFNRENFINLLPLVDFVRCLTGEDQWNPPPLRACFMLDDPNLHFTSYGFVNFPKLAQHAAHWNYHMSIATIPLDGWFSSRRSVQLFVEQRARMSLLVHGNDHVKNELASFASDAEAISSLAQALRRVARIEKTTKVAISKVMAAPFGACSEGTMSIMARLGFEAACISSGSLRHHNAGCPWSSSLGLRMAEIIEGLPVFPRFRLNREAKNTILLAAYLGQPIVPVGHHQDVADGLDILAELAQFINSLGQVQWGDMESIARSNFLMRHDGDLLCVRPYSKRFQVAVPARMRGISVEPPQGAFSEENVKIATSLGPTAIYSGPAGSPVAIDGGTLLDVRLERKDAIDPQSIADRGVKIWPIARRFLTEGRDRMRPLGRRLALSRSS
jgi:hypothetical protein